MSSPLPDLGAAFNRADYDGYIFDCDGTLADSMPLHYKAWTESLSDKLGRPAYSSSRSVRPRDLALLFFVTAKLKAHRG